MKCYIQMIGVIDKLEKLHSVEFTTGVNLITGKSSTGKSAMIEIFDYCFGNSNDTVPEGVITDYAQMYFVTMSLGDGFLVLARAPNSTKGFIKSESTSPEKSQYTFDYFNNEYFLSKDDFRKTLGRYFGINIEDTDTDLEDRKYRRNNAKSPRPSIRNFTSYMFQHQNLVANKHALFYRFDQQQKREQTIDQFKVFAGFIKQDYYIKQQELNEHERKLKELENKKSSLESIQNEKSKKIVELQKEYIAITGKPLLKDSADMILSNPAAYLDKLSFIKIESDIASKEYLNQIEGYKQERNELIAQRRRMEIKLNEIQSSIRYAEQHVVDLAKITTISETSLHISECPFCKNKNEELIQEANQLENAITWLNNELAKTPLLLDSFLADEKSLKNDIKNISQKINTSESAIFKINLTSQQLTKNKSLEEQALKIKLKIENILEEKIEFNYSDLDQQIKETNEFIKKIKKIIEENYNPEAKLRSAEKYINDAMKEIGDNLDFETSYKPINLKFSLENFDLWHEKSDGSKVYLRSMGSGANWLYCHISLFTAIHKYFCSLKDRSLLPPILFLDQPSQVYFPTSVDTGEEFNAKELKEQEGKIKNLDEDLKAVTNLINQLVLFCKRTGKETGIIPQIIITDHADNLVLDGIDFESLVNGRRWRKRGFIEISSKDLK